MDRGVRGVPVASGAFDVVGGPGRCWQGGGFDHYGAALAQGDPRWRWGVGVDHFGRGELGQRGRREPVGGNREDHPLDHRRVDARARPPRRRPATSTI